MQAELPGLWNETDFAAELAKPLVLRRGHKASAPLMAVGASLLTMLTAPALAQATASSPTEGTTTILEAIRISEARPLSIGMIRVPQSGTSTVSVGTTADTVRTTGTAAVVGETTGRARYTLSGEELSLSMPTILELTRPDSPAIRVTLRRSESGGVPGEIALDLGATFTIKSTTRAGTYAGTYVITANYN
jgi:hypothetical protein